MKEFKKNFLFLLFFGGKRLTTPPFCYKMITSLLGEWLNGRVAVSKTVGCVFESRLPCHTLWFFAKAFFVFVVLFLLTRNKVASDAIAPFAANNRYSVAPLLTNRVSPATRFGFLPIFLSVIFVVAFEFDSTF